MLEPLDSLVSSPLGLLIGAFVARFGYVLAGQAGNVHNAFLRMFTHAIQVRESDAGFEAIIAFISANVKCPHSTRPNGRDDTGSSSPGFGKHWFILENTLVSVDRRRDTEDKLNPGDVLEIRIWSRSNRAREQLLCALHGKTQFRVFLPSGPWFRSWLRQPRPLSTVYSAHAYPLLQQLQEFYRSQAWYEDKGIPHRKALLFHGPPRTGKTSLAHALASELKCGLYMINPNSCDDAEFSTLMNSVPRGSIILIEDLGARPSENLPSQPEGERAKRVTPSALLNGIDGIPAPVGVVIIATSNHPGSLSVPLRQRFEHYEFAEVDMSCLTPAQQEAVAAGQNQLTAPLG